jgi:hypothetical protein
MSSPKRKSAVRAATNTRVIIASFAAGVGSMIAAGLFAPVLLNGGLSLSDADAATTQVKRPAIVLDVAAVEAKLDEADRIMAVSRTRTDGAMNRLEHLSGG